MYIYIYIYNSSSNHSFTYGHERLKLILSNMSTQSFNLFNRWKYFTFSKYTKVSVHVFSMKFLKDILSECTIF